MKHTLRYAEFYITNVCNLTCQNCNRFNNYHFAGWQDWDDYADIYAKWANIVDIETPVILGGEPLLNPTILNWVRGTKALWPHRHWRITTNGTRLNHVRGLYDCIRETQCWVELSLHELSHFDEMVRVVDEFLLDPEYTVLPNGGHRFVDKNQVKVIMYHQNEFMSSAVLAQPDGSFNLHNSDINQAHISCSMSSSHHFSRGKLYKCGMVTVMPDFSQQYKLNISAEELKLLNSYQPLTVDHGDLDITQFFEQLKNPIDQCRFCPSSGETFPIRLEPFR